MIVGFLSDAHGNPAGLDRCLEALRMLGAETFFFLGDSVGYMPGEVAVLERLAAIGAICIQGNHEEMVLGRRAITPEQDAVYRLVEVRTRIHPTWTSWIADWPNQRELVLEGARLLLVHGSPSNPIDGYVYPDADLSAFSHLPYDLVLMGHTHRPFIRSAGPVTVVNTGSCGLPRDVGHLASCAVYDTATRKVEIIRVGFDARGLVSTLGSRIDRSVAACLQRVADRPIAGRVVDA